MTKYAGADGTEFTDQDIEKWAAEAESENGYSGDHLGPAVPGRPVSVGVEAKPFTIRLDVNRRAKLNSIAEQRHMTVSDLMRDLIDNL